MQAPGDAPMDGREDEKAMPRNVDKRRCAVPECRAWAKRGQELCAAHLSTRAMRAGQERAQVLDPLAALRDAVEASRQREVDDLGTLDDELRTLYTARALFLSWLHAEEGGPPTGIEPSAFFRAWNASTTRVIQLLRARRELGRTGSDLDAIIDDMEKDAVQLSFEHLVGDEMGSARPPA